MALSCVFGLDSCNETEDLDNKEVRIREQEELYLRMTEELEKEKLPPLMLEWEDGCVVLYRGEKEVKRIEEFTFVSTRKPYTSSGKHTGGYLWEDHLYNLLDVPRKTGYLYFQKHRNRYLTSYLGVSPSRMVRMLQACMFKAFIPEDLKEISQKYCRASGGKRSWVKDYVMNLHKRQDVVRQCINDKQENIIPLVLAQKPTEENINPSAIRKMIGKSLWKKVLKQSKTRNHLMVEAMRKGIVHSLPTAVELPTTLLKTGKLGSSYNDLDVVAVLKQKRLLSKTEEHRQVVNIIEDTKSMYRQLELDIPKQSKLWDLDKWKERHDFLTNKINLQKYSPEPFKWVSKLTKKCTSECGKITAVLLDNALDIRNEGSKMHHCVGSYSSRSADGKYLVWHIIDNISGKEELSTLGCWVGDESVRFNQHYGVCNSSVTGEEVKTFVDKLISSTNKQLNKGEHHEKSV